MPGNPADQEGSSSNRYTILGRLAGGGMADIFLAKSISEGGVERFVVLKRVLAERSRDPHFAKMFLDEARLAAQLQHPNIAQVHDIGKLGESYFFTMEYVHGEDIRSIGSVLTKAKLPMPLPFALHVAAGALAALHHAHERRASDGKRLDVVHRDVSPSNVMVSYEGSVKLLDFGVAKATQNNAETRAGTVKGKVSYLSPEQTSGAPVDRRSDIFALGILLWEMLTGGRLYKRENEFSTMIAIASEEPPPPSSQRALAPELDQIVLTALAKEPQDRYATAADMLEAIETFAAREGHVLSATSASRFMRERFGSPPEPWLELASLNDSSVTVHGEGIAELGLGGPDEPEATRIIKGSPRDTEARRLIEQQLKQAPEIHRSAVHPTVGLRPAPSRERPPTGPQPFPPPPSAQPPYPAPQASRVKHETGPQPYPPPPYPSQPPYPAPQASRVKQETGPQPYPPAPYPSQPHIAQPPYSQQMPRPQPGTVPPPNAPYPSAQQPYPSQPTPRAGTVPPPNASFPNAPNAPYPSAQPNAPYPQYPNAQQPNAAYPQNPNARQPNAQQPSAPYPNAQQPSAPYPNAQQPYSAYAPAIAQPPNAPLPHTPYPQGQTYARPNPHEPEDTAAWLRSGVPGPAPTDGGARAPMNTGYAAAPMHTPPRQLREAPQRDLRMPIILGVAAAMITLGVLIAVLVGN